MLFLQKQIAAFVTETGSTIDSTVHRTNTIYSDCERRRCVRDSRDSGYRNIGILF